MITDVRFSVGDSDRRAHHFLLRYTCEKVEERVELSSVGYSMEYPDLVKMGTARQE